MPALIQPECLCRACGCVALRCLDRHHPVILGVDQEHLGFNNAQAAVYLKMLQRCLQMGMNLLFHPGYCPA